MFSMRKQPWQVTPSCVSGPNIAKKSVVGYICLCVNQLDCNSRCRALGQLLYVDVNVTMWRVYLHVHSFILKRTQCYR